MALSQSTFPSSSDPSIPWIDMHDFLYGTPQQKLATAQKFGEALHHIGFVAIHNIGISTQLIDTAYNLAEDYFNLTEEEKRKHLAVDGRRGFIPFGTEHAKYTNVIDLKEFFHTTGPTQPEHLWPEFKGFKETMLALYFELQTCMRHCLEATAIYLGYTNEQEKTCLSDLLVSGVSLMRIIHYPPINPLTSPPGAVRSAAHEDLGIMTLIPRATRSGLQVQTTQGEWINVVVPDGAAIINSGDYLSMVTNGIIRSTTHRVINPELNDNSHRYSIPFFGNVPFDKVIKVLDKCKDAPNGVPLPEKEMTFGEFLHKRYEDIGIKK